MSAAADYAVGIDVGTTFTAAATCRGERAEVVSLGDRGDVIPSVAYLREDGMLLVGQAAERRAVADATRVARDFKRRVGDEVPLSLGGRPHTPEALTAAIVRWVVDFVTAREGGPPGRIVLTLPASWRDHRRQLLLDAAAAAGVEGAVLRAEPVAAAIHYASRHELPPGTTIGIYDLGGGTFDATIVRRSEHGFEIIGRPQGDDRLGGIDLDTLVWDHVVGVIGQRAVDPEGAPSPAQVRAVAQLRAAAVDAKEALSYDTEAVVPVALPELMTEVRITRAEFEEMARPALLRTVEVFRRTCDAAGLKPGDLHAVLLAGGSSRIPLISQLVGHELGASVASDAHPKLATCLGAAREAVVEGRSTAAGAGPGAAAATVAAPAVAASAVAAAAATPAADDTAAAAAPGADDVAAAPPAAEPVPDSPAAEPAAAPAAPRQLGDCARTCCSASTPATRPRTRTAPAGGGPGLAPAHPQARRHRRRRGDPAGGGRRRRTARARRVGRCRRAGRRAGDDLDVDDRARDDDHRGVPHHDGRRDHRFDPGERRRITRVDRVDDRVHHDHDHTPRRRTLRPRRRRPRLHRPVGGRRLPHDHRIRRLRGRPRRPGRPLHRPRRRRAGRLSRQRLRAPPYLGGGLPRLSSTHGDSGRPPWRSIAATDRTSCGRRSRAWPRCRRTSRASCSRSTPRWRSAPSSTARPWSRCTPSRRR